MIEKYELYNNFLKYEYFVASPNADVSGGILEKEQIDEIKNHPEIDRIKIMGLRQDTFEYFVKNYAHQFKAIYFFKNKGVKDLSLLGTLDKVEFIGYFFNQGCTKLWDMSQNEMLKGISINDFSKLHTIDEVASAPNLEFLDFGCMVWNKMDLESLKPLTMTKLKYLSFNAKKIVDNDITPIGEIKTLLELGFPTNLFTTEQIAWLTAKFYNLESSSLGPFHMIDRPIEWKTSGGIKMKDTIIHGKGKPFLDSKLDANRINKYVREFNILVEKYKENN